MTRGAGAVDGAPSAAEAVARGERGALARAMNLLESTRPEDRQTARALVDALTARPRPGGQVVGVTGPPGVGKSTLVGRLLGDWRARGWTVGVVAVDPSSRRSGGALLGDRARMAAPGRERDPGLFIRSMAARDRLGGLAPATFEAVLALRAGCDRVLVETVGVGQSETDVTTVADTTLVIVQPASGDTLQFLKAGLMEIPDVLAVNKADLGAVARRTRSDLRGALASLGREDVEIVLTSAADGQGVEALAEALERHRQAQADRLPAAREGRLREQVARRFRELYGTLAADRLGGEAGLLALLAALPVETAPGALLDALVARL